MRTRRETPPLRRRLVGLAALLAAVATIAGCGSSNSNSSTSGGGGSAASGGGASGSGAGVANPGSEAQSAATGDIPDNQVFLTFTNPAGGYSIKFPEGWARKGAGDDVSFQDKQNTIRIQVAKAPAPTVASAKAELAAQKGSHPSLSVGAATQTTINGAPVVKVTYTQEGPPDPVTGKRLPIITDRYEYAKGGKRAIVDLGTPKGVDNVDAYRMISESFRWR